MHFHTVNVTPELASSWLSSNDKNRSISRPHVLRLAEAMKNGQWSLNGQTISFDDNGRLLDGQHRLSAVVESGVTVQMSVAIGVTDPGAFVTYDTLQLKRGAHHIAEMFGVKSANKAAAAARVILAWETAETPNQFASLLKTGMRDAKSAAIAEKAKEISEELAQAQDMMGTRLPRASGADSLVLAMIILFNRVDPVSCSSFAMKLTTGIFEDEHDPCLQLRDRLLAGRGAVAHQAWKPTLAALMVKAFSYHRQGMGIKNLRWRQEGNRPEPFPTIAGAESCK